MMPNVTNTPNGADGGRDLRALRWEYRGDRARHGWQRGQQSKPDRRQFVEVLNGLFVIELAF